MEINEFFNTDRPYEIANGITRGHELTTDLVCQVYLIMLEKETPENIGAFFNSIASKQWRLPNSEFNKLHRPVFTVEFNESFMSEEEETIIHMDKFKDSMIQYLDELDGTPVEWFTKEIAKMVMSGKTYRQIQSDTGINTSQITKSIKQFKNDVFNYYHSRFD